MEYNIAIAQQLSSMLKSLRKQSGLTQQDRKSFYKVQILFWMLAATDGHAKNFSIFYDASGSYRMTPIYDVLSARPMIGEQANQLSSHDVKLAMAFRSTSAHYRLKEIAPWHLYAVAAKLGLGGEIDAIIEEILAAMLKVISSVSAMLPPGFPQRVAGTIFAGLETSAAQIEAASQG